MATEKITQILEKHPDLKSDLFIRGFLITTKKIENLDKFPFYNNWSQKQCGKLYLLKHSLANIYTHTNNKNLTFFICGHAYDPFTMKYDENEILKDIAAAHKNNKYLEKINDLTGNFVLGIIDDKKIEFLVDPSGMQSACWGKINNDFYISSHPQLIADICNLKMDDFAYELTKYKWYGRVMGPYLPADLTSFSEVKRIVPSIFYKYDNELTHKRYWPLVPQNVAEGKEYDKIIQQAGDILKNNMKLVSQKWKNPWISLTGGIDSNTTFAAANNNYDKFNTFSYLSAEKEIPDVKAAKTIAGAFNVKHHEYNIPESNKDISLFEERRELFRHNSAYAHELYDNEARKKFFLRDNAKCDVEVKSWTSETIRCYWYKHYGRKKMPKLSPKLYRNLYKIFISNRKLAHQVDKLFEEYLEKYEYYKIPDSYPPADMHYNDVTWGSWGGMNISEMRYCFEITIPYNNRRFLDLMFRAPIDKRISDEHHLDLKKYLNKELWDMNIRIVNAKETAFRAWALNVIFTFNSFLPL